jgi:drug/metabolite transporter (DMT)-like permease
MTFSNTWKTKLAAFGIAALCFGYFASYVPYSMMTKMITKGLVLGLDGDGLTGFQIQPLAVLGSFTAMYIFISLAGWWKHATHSKVFGISIPRPQWYTSVAGVCTAGQIITTTLAYTFDGISIVFAMLLMRGGVLMMAPIVDMIVKKRQRHIYWPSFVAAVLAMAALVVAFAGKGGTAMTWLASINIGCYLLGYFFRLAFMSRWAKSDDPIEKKRYFTEEQMVANPLLFFALLVIGLFGIGSGTETIPGQIWTGFSQLPFQGFFIYVFMLGVFSYGTGLFGSLIYLDKRENTFTVPANRSASIIAGVIATYLLSIFFGQRYPGTNEIAGAAIIIAAIAFLAYRQVVEKRSKSPKPFVPEKLEAEAEA